MTSRRHRPGWLTACLIGLFVLALAADPARAAAAQSERFGFVSDGWDRNPVFFAEPFTRLTLGWNAAALALSDEPIFVEPAG